MVNIENRYGGEGSQKCLLYFGIALVTFFLISTTVNVKFFEVFGLKFGAAALFFPFCLVIGDIVTEVYGFKKAKKIIIAALFARIAFGLSIWVVIQLPPPVEWKNQPELEIIFGQMTKNVFAGCIAYLVAELSNSYILSRMKIWSNGRHFALRAMVSTAVAEFLHTTTFVIIAFGGSMPLSFLVQVIINATILKTLIEALVLPLTIVLCRKVKQMEGMDYFDATPKEVLAKQNA